MTMNNPVWKGYIKPQITKRKAIHAYHKDFDIGRTPDAKFFTICKVWVNPPTLEYPSTGLFLSFNNGNSSCFTRLENSEELKTIGKQLVDIAKEVEKIILSLKPSEELIDKQLKSYQEQRNALEIMSRLQGGNPPAQEEPPIEEMEQ